MGRRHHSRGFSHSAGTNAVPPPPALILLPAALPAPPPPPAAAVPDFEEKTEEEGAAEELEKEEEEDDDDDEFMDAEEGEEGKGKENRGAYPTPSITAGEDTELGSTQ